MVDISPCSRDAFAPLLNKLVYVLDSLMAGHYNNVIDLMMKITGRIIFKTTFRCPHDTIIRSKYNIQQITRIVARGQVKSFAFIESF